MKGPAAATLYGIQAANGVVLITTKRGVAGKPRWNLFAEQGAVDDQNTYRTNYFGRSDDPEWDPLLHPPVQRWSRAIASRPGRRLQPAERPSPAPLGRRASPAVRRQRRGRQRAATYYLSADYEGEVGVYQAPRIRLRLGERGHRGQHPGGAAPPNELDKLNLRANGTAKVSSERRSPALTRLRHQPSAPRGERQHSEFGDRQRRRQRRTPGHQPRLVLDPRRDLRRAEPPGRRAIHRRAHRELACRSLALHPGHLRLRRHQPARTRSSGPPARSTPLPIPRRTGRGQCHPRAQTSQTLGRPVLRARTYKLSPAMGRRTAVGGQFFRNLNTNSFAQGRGLARGSESIFGAATTDASDDYVESRSAGGFVDQQMSFSNRLFLTGGLRLDDNSAFGKNFSTKPLPKLSASWLALEQRPGRDQHPAASRRLRAVDPAAGQHRRAPLLRPGRRPEGREPRQRRHARESGQRGSQARAVPGDRGRLRRRPASATGSRSRPRTSTRTPGTR